MAMDRAQQIEALREAVRRATVTFLERAPEGGHGEVVLDEGSGQKLVYRRVDREYGIYVETRPIVGKPALVALDKAPTRWLISGSKRIGDLFTAVMENHAGDVKKISEGVVAATSFVEQFEPKEPPIVRLTRDGRFVEVHEDPAQGSAPKEDPWAILQDAIRKNKKTANFGKKGG